MYQILGRNSFADNTPFQFARMEYLRGRIDENFQKLVLARRLSTGRLDSNHLLRTILLSLAVEFTGDLQSYIQNVNAAARRLCSGLGITSSFSKGRLHTESNFYSECPEIILYAQESNWSIMDLWRNWRTLESVKVINHPITGMDVIELAVMNEARIEHPDLAVITIDIPLLAAQWQMWKVANPAGLMEHFITEIPLVNLLKSHLNVAFFNKLQLELGIKTSCRVDTNLPFAQTPTDAPASALAGDVYSQVSQKEMRANVILDSIPVIYGRSYLDNVTLPSMPPTTQVLWAIQASRMEPAAVVLAFGALAGFDKMTHDITVLRRTLIQNKEDKTLTNGLSTAATDLLQERMERLVVSRLPA